MNKLVVLSVTLIAALILAVSAALPASSQAGYGYSYGPKGSCYVKVKGKRYAGYKEYYNHRPTGRCVLQ